MKRLTERLTVSGQVRPEDVPGLKAAGVAVLVNNRPDGEEPGQPDGDSVRAAAQAEGMIYLSAPTTGRPTQVAIEAIRTALSGAGHVHAFCKSGTRSTYAWAAMAAQDGVPLEEIAGAARAAGYDVTPLFA